MNDNKFEIFPPQIMKLTSLNELKLNDNQIPTIPSEINQLSSLQTL